MKKIIAIALSALLLSGCSVVYPVPADPVVDLAQIEPAGGVDRWWDEAQSKTMVSIIKSNLPNNDFTSEPKEGTVEYELLELTELISSLPTESYIRDVTLDNFAIDLSKPNLIKTGDLVFGSEDEEAIIGFISVYDIGFIVNILNTMGYELKYYILNPTTLRDYDFNNPGNIPPEILEANKDYPYESHAVVIEIDGYSVKLERFTALNYLVMDPETKVFPESNYAPVYLEIRKVSENE